jgi:hypothetical protein
MNERAYREGVLSSFGADAAEQGELLEYNANVFDHARLLELETLPLADEPFVSYWERYETECRRVGNILCLSDRLVQLQFPVREGMSTSPEYIAVTRQGMTRRSGVPGLELEAPELCTVALHETWAGRIPILQPATRPDFVALVQAFTKRNEPVPIPNSMGACIVSGYNNWHRFSDLRSSWEQDHPGQVATIQSVAHLKHLYQDRFLILSDGFYSGMQPETMGLDSGQWKRVSFVIRREHESAHYWTRRIFSSMRACLLDEIIADCCGIYAAWGRFNERWLLEFLGLERFPIYRKGGRLENYRGNPPLSNGAFRILQSLVAAAAGNLRRFDRLHGEEFAGHRGQLHLLLTLSEFTIEELASEDSPALLARSLERAISTASRLCRMGPEASFVSQSQLAKEHHS